MGDSPRAARGADQVRGQAPRAHVAALLGRAGVAGLLCMLVACGGRPASPSTPSASPPASSSGSSDYPVSTGAAGQPGPAADTPPAGQPGAPASAVTEAECQALLAHVVAVANRAHTQSVTPETAPTEAQLADIRARMAPEFIPLCMGLERATIACQMRASTRDQLLACM
jgi:hypothetical protein